MRRCIIVVGCLLIATTRTLAQTAPHPPVPIGSRVRVESVNKYQVDTTRLSRLSGRLTADRPDSLFIQTKAGAVARSVAQSDIRGLWVSRGVGGPKTMRGIGMGALIGAVVVGGIAGISEAGCDNTPLGAGPSFGIGPCFGVGPAIGVGAVAGGLLGAVIGGLVGGSKRYELWERIR